MSISFRVVTSCIIRLVYTCDALYYTSVTGDCSKSHTDIPNRNQAHIPTERDRDAKKETSRDLGITFRHMRQTLQRHMHTESVTCRQSETQKNAPTQGSLEDTQGSTGRYKQLHERIQ